MVGMVNSVWRGDEVAARVQYHAQQAHRRAAQQLLARTLPRTPILTGHLRSTGHVAQQGSDTSGVVFDADYAIYVHEIMNRHHPIGQAKFLEQTLEDIRGALLMLMAREMGESFT